MFNLILQSLMILMFNRCWDNCYFKEAYWSRNSSPETVSTTCEWYLYRSSAGLLDPNETLEQCAERELHEETGYIGKAVRSSPVMFCDPGFATRISSSSQCLWTSMIPGTRTLFPNLKRMSLLKPSLYLWRLSWRVKEIRGSGIQVGCENPKRCWWNWDC